MWEKRETDMQRRYTPLEVRQELVQSIIKYRETSLSQDQQ